MLCDKVKIMIELILKIRKRFIYNVVLKTKKSNISIRLFTIILFLKIRIDKACIYPCFYHLARMADLELLFE